MFESLIHHSLHRGLSVLPSEPAGCPVCGEGGKQSLFKGRPCFLPKGPAEGLTCFVFTWQSLILPTPLSFSREAAHCQLPPVSGLPALCPEISQKLPSLITSSILVLYLCVYHPSKYVLLLTSFGSDPCLRPCSLLLKPSAESLLLMSPCLLPVIWILV